MTVYSEEVDRAAVTATAARLLAAWWSRPAEEDLAWWDAAWEAAGLLGLPGVDELRTACEDAEPETLRAEYERLFAGPGRTPCAPYESLWRTDAPRREQGRLMASCAADVVRVYRELGLQVQADAHELPDHVAVEWEALAYAVEHGAGEASGELLEHLARWMPAFCAAVEAEAEAPFYAALARLTPEWLAALAA